MAAIPGVTVQQGITDVAGNPAIGVSDDGGYDQLLLDPVSYQVTGLRQLSTGIGPRMPRARSNSPSSPRPAAGDPAQGQAAQQWPPKGAVVQSLAYAQVSEVSGPGVK